MTRLWRILPFVGLFSLTAFPADASDRLPVAGPTDFWFEFTEPSVFQVRAYAIQNGIDSHLWLYAEDGTLVAANDDWFGLDSWLDVPVQAGRYRLRAGVCCGNPDAWYGSGYELEANTVAVEPTTTTTSTTSTTTTEAPTTTTTEPETTTTVEETTTTVEETTTTSEPETTTTEPPTTSTQPEETWPPTTPPAPPPPKTTTSSSSTTSTTSSTTSTSTTTTTTLPETTTTEPTTTLPATTVPAVTTVASTEPATVPPVSSSAPPAETTTTTTIPPVETDIPEAPPVGASEEQKREFESEVNVFSGAYDNYVPAGSTITVAQRRTMVAATVAMSTALPSPARRRRN